MFEIVAKRQLHVLPPASRIVLIDFLCVRAGLISNIDAILVPALLGEAILCLRPEGRLHSLNVFQLATQTYLHEQTCLFGKIDYVYANEAFYLIVHAEHKPVELI